MDLPPPLLVGERTLEETLHQRRSVRAYAAVPVTLPDMAQLLWAAQGITDQHGFRTAPSAGALYPLEVYLVAGSVDGLTPGIYHYRPHRHQLHRTVGGDRRAALARAALRQTWVRDGAAALVFTAVYERTTRRYGKRGIRYVHMEAGHAAQNVLLQATALGLAAAVVGAFDDSDVQDVLGLEQSEHPLSIIPVGKP